MPGSSIVAVKRLRSYSISSQIVNKLLMNGSANQLLERTYFSKISQNWDAAEVGSNLILLFEEVLLQNWNFPALPPR